MKHSQIIVYVSIKYRAESHAEMCGQRPKKKKKKNSVVSVREKKVRVSMKTNSNQELPKETKRENCLSTAPGV